MTAKRLRLGSVNEIRHDDTIFARATKAARLVKLGMQQQEVAVAFGVTGSTISLWLNMTRLVPELQAVAAENRMSLDLATALARLPRGQQVKAFVDLQARAGTKPQEPKPNGQPPVRPKRLGPRPFAHGQTTAVGRAKHLARWLVMEPEAAPVEVSVAMLWIVGEATNATLLEHFPRLERFIGHRQPRKAERESAAESGPLANGHQ
jgi:hypothetical protein